MSGSGLTRWWHGDKHKQWNKKKRDELQHTQHHHQVKTAWPALSRGGNASLKVDVRRPPSDPKGQTLTRLRGKKQEQQNHVQHLTKQNWESGHMQKECLRRWSQRKNEHFAQDNEPSGLPKLLYGSWSAWDMRTTGRQNASVDCTQHNSSSTGNKPTVKDQPPEGEGVNQRKRTQQLNKVTSSHDRGDG